MLRNFHEQIPPLVAAPDGGPASVFSPRFFLFAVTARAEPAMWVIKDKDSTIYLIGTLHLLRHDMEWDAAKVKKTVGESTELWLEIADADNQANLICPSCRNTDSTARIRSPAN